MSYADLLEERFRGLDPRVDDLFLLEAHQIEMLPSRAPAPELAAVLHGHPALLRFLVARHPPIESALRRLLAEHVPVGHDELVECEMGVLWEIADWIVYQRAPHRYDEVSDFDEHLTAITDLVVLSGKVVIDAGAGTGELAIAASREARHVFAIEPVGTLRSFIRNKAEQLGLANLFVLDGLLSRIPLPAASADVLLTRQSIGWSLDEELAEIERVLTADGTAAHLVGMPHPAPPGDELHQRLLDDGYRPDVYHEGGAAKRRYIKRFGAEPASR